MSTDLSPSEEVGVRLRTAIANRPSATRAQWSRRLRLVMGASLVPLAVVLAIRGLPTAGRPAGYVALVAAGWCAIVISASRWVLRGGPSPLGRPRPLLALLAVGLPAALLAMSVLASALFPETLVEPAYGARTHLACAMTATVLSVAPVGCLLWVFRGSDPVKPWVTGAALGTVAASWAGTLVAVQCPHPEPLHVALAHAAPMLAIMLASGLVAARLLALRWIDTSSR